MSRLTREQSNAIQVFISQRPYLDQLFQQKDEIVFETGFVAARYAEYRLSQLPSGKHWAWNQSNARVVVQVDDHTQLILKKVSPRVRLANSGHPVPSLKLWISWIKSTHNQDYYFLWVEKGEEPGKNCIETEIGPVYPGQISIESLSFLMPFVDSNTARELGWLRN